MSWMNVLIGWWYGMTKYTFLCLLVLRFGRVVSFDMVECGIEYINFSFLNHHFIDCLGIQKMNMDILGVYHNILVIFFFESVMPFLLEYL